MRVIACSIAVLLALSALAAPARAGQGPVGRQAPPRSCAHSLHFDGSPYGLLAHGVSCHFARYWAKRYQRTGMHPRHWSCVGRSPGTEDASCQDRRSRDYFEYYIQD